MTLHFAILFWLALIFIVAGTFIFVLMKKLLKNLKRILFKLRCYFLYFWIRNANLYINIWNSLNQCII